MLTAFLKKEWLRATIIVGIALLVLSKLLRGSWLSAGVWILLMVSNVIVLHRAYKNEQGRQDL